MSSQYRENKIRIYIFTGAALFHIILLFLVVFPTTTKYLTERQLETASIRLVDLEERPPPPAEPPPPVTPPPSYSEIPEDYPDNAVEGIAENLIASDTVPDQIVISGLRSGPVLGAGYTTEPEYLPMSRVSTLPVMPDREIRNVTKYPEFALRAGIEGRVILELFIDSYGNIKNIIILQETPANRGFGEAAVNAIKAAMLQKGVTITPAKADDQDVAVRFRYPISFTVR